MDISIKGEFGCPRMGRKEGYNMNDFYTIISSDGKVTGKAHEDEDLYCEIEDCTGTQYIVEWEDGDKTVVCGCGLKWINENTAQIEGNR
jgi:hypothetical protein